MPIWVIGLWSQKNVCTETNETGADIISTPASDQVANKNQRLTLLCHLICAFAEMDRRESERGMQNVDHSVGCPHFQTGVLLGLSCLKGPRGPARLIQSPAEPTSHSVATVA